MYHYELDHPVVGPVGGSNYPDMFAAMLDSWATGAESDPCIRVNARDLEDLATALGKLKKSIRKRIDES